MDVLDGWLDGWMKEGSSHWFTVQAHLYNRSLYLSIDDGGLDGKGSQWMQCVGISKKHEVGRHLQKPCLFASLRGSGVTR